MDPETAYRDGYRVTRELLRGLEHRELSLPCPQCPGWSVRDVVAHHVHIFVERTNGSVPKEIAAAIFDAARASDHAVKLAASRRRDAWIERGVESFRPQPFASVLAAWESAMERANDNSWTSVGDLAVHIGDIEEALGVDGSRENAVVVAALRRYGSTLTDHLRGQGVDTVVLVGSRPAYEGGDPESPHRVSGRAYELLRVITGRRSRAEADQALDWGSTPKATRQVFPIYDWLTAESGAVLSLPD